MLNGRSQELRCIIKCDGMRDDSVLGWLGLRYNDSARIRDGSHVDQDGRLGFVPARNDTSSSPISHQKPIKGRLLGSFDTLQIFELLAISQST